MPEPFRLPRLYAIVDASRCSGTRAICAFAEALAASGVSLIQYRNKTGAACQILAEANALRQALGTTSKLIMNDRADLCRLAGFDGLHLGQDDLSPESARRIVGARLWLGLSTHHGGQIGVASRTSANYLAIGPVFETGSKINPDPVIGLEGVRRARSLTTKPLVAIGGITRANCRQVIEAGADSVAVLSDLLINPRESAGDFLRILR
ncbi:MAG: thiamine phosphate synthase [Acidobacteria bacterium]|nr:thiamine phosphate synthase [Acidobacteriota bacterium]